jgi:hypothetical protein
VVFHGGFLISFFMKPAVTFVVPCIRRIPPALRFFAALAPPSRKRVISSHTENSITGERIVGDKPFLTDIKTLRERARRHIEQGAVTEGYTADRETVIKLLNEALATEIVCVLRYKRRDTEI